MKNPCGLAGGVFNLFCFSSAGRYLFCTPVDCFRELWHNFDIVRDSLSGVRMVTEGKQFVIIIRKEGV